MSAKQHDVMTAAEVADYLQIPVRSVHDYAARDELPSVESAGTAASAGRPSKP